MGRGELLRKLTHIAVGGFAFLLRDLTWPQAALLAGSAFLFNWQILPRLGGRALWREAETRAGLPFGVLVYPLAVLALVLIFRHELWKAAMVWAVLAAGDGMASIAGQILRGPRLPWNGEKSWSGFLAFVVFGVIGAVGLAVWTCRLTTPPLPLVALGIAVALGCALVESLPSRLDDNVTVPLSGAVLVQVLSLVRPETLWRPDLGTAVAVGAGLNVAIALAAHRARSIDISGAVSAVFIGTAIVAGLGLAAFALMMAFFVVGSAATKLGYRVKAARGIAQEKGGARSWQNAWANGGVPAFLALLGGMAPPEHRLLFTLAYAASVATAAADTCSSEVGKAYGRRTFLITTFRPVPPGTEGAISLEGTLGGLLGGALIGGLGALVGLYGWPAAAAVAVAGLLGSLAESVIGTVAEKRGWLDNNLLNALNTAIGAGLVLLLDRAVS